MRIHIAGLPIRVGSVYRQRCAWCDVVLIDGDTANEMVASSGCDPRVAFWGLGALVAVEGNGSWVAPDDGEKLPRECCASQWKPPELVVVPKAEP